MTTTITLYVDGACRGNPGLGGWGAYLQHADHEQKICGGEAHTTNNRMELTAAIQGILACPADASLTIYTDSNYVKQGITEWIHGWKKKNWKDVKNPDLWQQLDAACQGRKIEWHWIKGHAGHAGNEMADQLANLGADQTAQQLSTNTATATNKDDAALKKLDVQMPSEPEPNMKPQSDQATLHVKKDTATSEDWLLDDPFGFDLMADDSEDTELAVSMTTDHTSADQHPMQTQIEDAELQAHSTAKPSHIEDVTQATADNDFALNPDSPQLAELHPQIIVTAAHLQLQGPRQLILDTETTGFYYQDGDRVIEIGAIEMINRKLTGSSIHIYVKPDKSVGDSFDVHGISDAFLADKPAFAEIAAVLFDYLKDAEIVAHNANFDMNFLDMEFQKAGYPALSSVCAVVDTLVMAKHKHPGQKNSLDALVRRYEIIARDRTFHGALLDAEILADVYLAMTGGQVSLDIDAASDQQQQSNSAMASLHGLELPIVLPSATELAAHAAWMAQFEQKNQKKCLFDQ